MITSKITNVTLHLDPFVEAWDLVIFGYTIIIIIIISNLPCRRWRRFAAENGWIQSNGVIYLFFFFSSKTTEFTTFKVVKSLTPFSQKKKILSINLFQAWGERIDCNVFDCLIRTTLLVLPLGWRRQMQGKLKAFISNTMNTMLELLTRGNRLTGMYVSVYIYIYSNDSFLFSIFSVIRYRV